MPDIIDNFAGDYAFLSNFYPSEVWLDGRAYPTVEHAFQAAKVEDDAPTRFIISKAATPGEAKRLGRHVSLRPYWDVYLKHQVMRDLLAQKFGAANHRDLAEALRDTKDAILIEGNSWHDNIWGDCRCMRMACKTRGTNLLGWMLMSRRAELG